jgi:hypothetical protein
MWVVRSEPCDYAALYGPVRYIGTFGSMFNRIGQLNDIGHSDPQKITSLGGAVVSAICRLDLVTRRGLSTERSPYMYIEARLVSIFLHLKLSLFKSTSAYTYQSHHVRT